MVVDEAVARGGEDDKTCTVIYFRWRKDLFPTAEATAAGSATAAGANAAAEAATPPTGEAAGASKRKTEMQLKEEKHSPDTQTDTDSDTDSARSETEKEPRDSQANENKNKKKQQDACRSPQCTTKTPTHAREQHATRTADSISNMNREQTENSPTKLSCRGSSSSSGREGDDPAGSHATNAAKSGTPESTDSRPEAGAASTSPAAAPAATGTSSTAAASLEELEGKGIRMSGLEEIAAIKSNLDVEALIRKRKREQRMEEEAAAAAAAAAAAEEQVPHART